MDNEYCILYEGGIGEYEEKKSRFIATVCIANSEEEALTQLEQVKKKYWDARHNCYAYVIGAHAEIQRCSDDGEPSGTAGRPMLDVILGQNVHNILVVCTLYFGGTLLGTGGLVRAYSKAPYTGMQNCQIITKTPVTQLLISTDDNELGTLHYILPTNN